MFVSDLVIDFDIFNENVANLCENLGNKIEREHI